MLIVSVYLGYLGFEKHLTEEKHLVNMKKI